MSKNDDDISKLVAMLNDLEEQLEYFIRYRSRSFESSHNNEEQIQKLLHDAWESSKPRFQILRNYLKDRPIEKLQSVGLTGSELALKIYLVNESLAELKTEEQNFLKLESPSRFRSLTSRISRLTAHWGKYLDFVDTILGSLGVAGMPNADAIAEIKETIEKIIDWWKKA